ncbi:MAG: alcohol dehydrogenase catalytic domain-containing protein, partial [Calditrichaeota bacterium]|nr:alcohol dehydrogenase catalytic domain-containing protein [Calditrichota bacterium]
MIHGRAMVTDGQGGFRLEAIEVDPPQPGEVLVALRASGVCHTDYDSMRWGNTLIMGHEGAGVVAGVGEGVDGFVPGDHVLLNWAIP